MQPMAIVCAQCATELDEGAAICGHCGAAVAEASAESGQAAESLPLFSGTSAFSIGSDLEGIGGWLILVAVGLAVGPFFLLKGIYVDLHVLYSVQFQESLARLPGLASLILFEAASNSIFLLALVTLNVLFYRKKKAFPGWMITYLAINCAVILIDHFGAVHYAPHTQLSGVMRSVIGATVWIPYYLFSDRVKATFVN